MFVVCVCADLLGVKHNMEIAFPLKPTLEELQDETERLFRMELWAQDRHSSDDFSVARFMVYQESTRRWTELALTSQLRPWAQLYATQMRNGGASSRTAAAPPPQPLPLSAVASSHPRDARSGSGNNHNSNNHHSYADHSNHYSSGSPTWEAEEEDYLRRRERERETHREREADRVAARRRQRERERLAGASLTATRRSYSPRMLRAMADYPAEFGFAAGDLPPPAASRRSVSPSGIPISPPPPRAGGGAVSLHPSSAGVYARAAPLSSVGGGVARVPVMEEQAILTQEARLQSQKSSLMVRESQLARERDEFIARTGRRPGEQFSPSPDDWELSPFRTR